MPACLDRYTQSRRRRWVLLRCLARSLGPEPKAKANLRDKQESRTPTAFAARGLHPGREAAACTYAVRLCPVYVRLCPPPHSYPFGALGFVQRYVNPKLCLSLSLIVVSLSLPLCLFLACLPTIFLCLSACGLGSRGRREGQSSINRLPYGFGRYGVVGTALHWVRWKGTCVTVRFSLKSSLMQR